MQLPLCAFLAWIAMIIVSLVPKKLSIFDLLFLYSVTMIMTTLTYTMWDINLGISTIDKTPRISFSIIICRMVTIPLLVLVAVNALQGTKKHWSVAVTVWIVLIVFDVLLNKIGLIHFKHNGSSHFLISSIANLLFIFIVWLCAWWYKKDDRKERASH